MKPKWCMNLNSYYYTYHHFGPITFLKTLFGQSLILVPKLLDTLKLQILTSGNKLGSIWDSLHSHIFPSHKRSFWGASLGLAYSWLKFPLSFVLTLVTILRSWHCFSSMCFILHLHGSKCKWFSHTLICFQVKKFGFIYVVYIVNN